MLPGPVTPARRVLVGAAVGILLTAAGSTPQGQSAPSLQQLELRYEGAFRVPGGGTDTQDTFEYGGTAVTFDSVRRSLWMVGHDHYQRAAEVTVPDVRIADNIGGLDTAQLLTPFRDLLQGRRSQIGGTDAKIGGLIREGSDWIASAWLYYDAEHVQSRSHFRVAASGTVTGPFQLGTEDRRAGFVSGYMAPIPPEWQGRLGGTALTGQCCIPIISRTSLGPGAAVFDPRHVGTRATIPVTQVLGYPQSHPTLGHWEAPPGGLFNGNTQVGGVVFPRDSSTVLFFGRVGLGDFCYGTGTPERNLHGRPVPGSGGFYCYDPAGFDVGTHGYPYALHVWAYDANDMVAVREGRTAPWDIHPYAAGVFQLPFERGLKTVGGATYDEATGRIFVSVLLQDDALPVIHVLRMGDDHHLPLVPTPTPPRPSPGGRQRPSTSPVVGQAVPRQGP